MAAMEHRDNQMPEKAPTRNWVFPKAITDDEPEDAPPRVTLCSLPPAEANELCARLERNGIPCDSFSAARNCDDATQRRLVTITVAESDLTAAQSIQAGDEPEVTPQDREFEAEMAARRIEGFICPKCNKVTLENLRLPAGWFVVRNWCVFIVLSPIVLAILYRLAPLSLLAEIADTAPYIWIAIWISTAFLLLWILVGAREKCCTQCGWRSDE